jgi:sialate O-acetylesterase
MVLQAGKADPVWGWAQPAETVTVSFAGQKKQATAGSDGAWKVALDPLAISAQPTDLTISGMGAESLTFHDVLVGEVWLCSGQSNMGKPVGLWRGMNPTPNYQQELAAADYPLIRLLQPRAARSATPQRDFDEVHRDKEYANGGWEACTPVTLDQLKFSAVGYFFGRKLFRELHVPIGLINASSGGTRIEEWTPASGFASMPSLAGFATACQTPGAKFDDIVPSLHYNGEIAPMVPFAIRGIIWYQGESNIYVNDGSAYADKMTALIKSWRAEWHEELPFYFVQLPPLLYSVTRKQVKSPDALPLLREAQTTALLLPHTGMVVTTDLADDLKNIHPVNKVPVGERLARWALANEYGRKDVEVSGPLYRPGSIEREGSKAVLHFTHVGKGLVSEDGKPLTWFTAAGSDGIFQPAKAEISGDAIVVTSPQIANVVNVRFAWDEGAEPNFFNKDGLPASPFRTDSPFPDAP